MKRLSSLSYRTFIKVMLILIFFALLGCLSALLYAIHKSEQGAFVEALWHLDLWNDAVKYTPVALVSIFSGCVGAMARIYMDEMKVGKLVGFHDLDDTLKTRLLKDYGFRRHNFLLGIVASFVAIITLGEELSVLHQAVMGVLTSIVGPQFLLQHIEGNGNESPNLEILQSRFAQIAARATLTQQNISAPMEIAATQDIPS